MFLRNVRIALHLLLFVLVVTFITCHWYGAMRLCVPNHLICSSKKWFYGSCGFEHSPSFWMLEKLGPFLSYCWRDRRWQFPIVKRDVGLAFELQKWSAWCRGLSSAGNSAPHSHSHFPPVGQGRENWKSKKSLDAAVNNF